MKKTLIWTLPIRLFHWFLTVGFIAAFIAVQMRESIGMNPHFAFGMFVGTLVFFRILFGFFGTRYAHFKDFPLTEVSGFVSSMLKRKEEKEYVGHNPLASLVMLGIIFGLLLTAMSGMAIRLTKGAEVVANMHKMFFMFSLMMVALHLLGLLSDFFMRKHMGTLNSMFTGYKNVQAEPAELTNGQKIFSVLWLIAPLIAFAIGANLPSKKPIDDTRLQKKIKNSNYGYVAPKNFSNGRQKS